MADLTHRERLFINLGSRSADAWSSQALTVIPLQETLLRGLYTHSLINYHLKCFCFKVKLPHG